MNEEARKQALDSGISPLEYLLGIMRHGDETKERMNAAIAAAPYVHAKLSSVDINATVAATVQITAIERKIIDPK
jgi:hypothetical protein